MANTLVPQDAYALINAISAQALGASSIAAVDTTTFVSVGETLLSSSLDNTLNAISCMIAKTIFAARPYKAKLSSLERGEERFGAITRKITYLHKDAEPSNDYNTQVSGYTTQLADGNSIDMYKINAPKAMQFNFPGLQILQRHITRFRNQLAVALQSEQELLNFWEGAMVEFYNLLEEDKEERSRSVLFNYIAGKNAMSNGVVDLVAEFNTRYSTTYTRAQLLSTYLPDFMKFVAARIKVYSSLLTERSVNYHASITGYDKIVRHTPKERQKMIMYNPIFIEAESQVYSSLFNPQYLEIGDFEGINYWQSAAAPAEIICKPNILNVSNGQSTDGTSQTMEFVLGILYDEEALGVMTKFDYSGSTPFNVAGGYSNLYYHASFKSYADYTENAIVFILGAGGV